MSKSRKHKASAAELANDPSLKFNRYLRWEPLYSDLHKAVLRFGGYTDDGYVTLVTVDGLSPMPGEYSALSVRRPVYDPVALTSEQKAHVQAGIEKRSTSR